MALLVRIFERTCGVRDVSSAKIDVSGYLHLYFDQDKTTRKVPFASTTRGVGGCLRPDTIIISTVLSPGTNALPHIAKRSYFKLADDEQFSIEGRV
jgi:hypothetical protein